jgi:ABC-type transport system substrate-binding protein
LLADLGTRGALFAFLVADFAGSGATPTEPVAASEAWYFDAIDDQLFIQGLNGNLEPDLATGYKFVNGTTFTMYLRHGVTYSDGTPFDAQSVAANIRRDLEP